MSLHARTSLGNREFVFRVTLHSLGSDALFTFFLLGEGKVGLHFCGVVDTPEAP